MSDRRNYNGLQMNQIPNIGDRQKQMQQAIAQEMQAITREIYVRAASADIADPEAAVSVEHYESLARYSKIAAQAYFTGLGVITVEEPEQP